MKHFIFSKRDAGIDRELQAIRMSTQSIIKHRTTYVKT